MKVLKLLVQLINPTVQTKRILTMSQPLIIQYANLLHKHRGFQAKAVKAFVERHTDPTFRKRVKVLNQLFRLKMNLVDV